MVGSRDTSIPLQKIECYTSYTIHLYCYAGATPYISITSRCYTIHLYCYAGATPYISITTRCYTIHLYCYTIHLYCYAGATPYISIATQVLHHTSLLLHMYSATQYYTVLHNTQCTSLVMLHTSPYTYIKILPPPTTHLLENMHN